MDKESVSLIDNTENIDWNKVAALFVSVGWDKRDIEKVKHSFIKSTHRCFLINNDEIIAVGRTVDDDCYYGLIVDVAVHPDFQGKGLGTKVVNYLKSKMIGYNFITLTAAPGKDAFYEKIGWKRQSSAFIWPRNEIQQQEHCLPQK